MQGFSRCIAALAILSFITLGGWPFEASSRGAGNDAGQLSVFLSLKDPSGPSLRLKVASLEIVSQNRLLPLLQQPLELDAARIGRGQVFMGRRELPADQYTAIRITLEKASLQTTERQVFLGLEKPVFDIPLPSPLTLQAGESPSLFITWDTAASLVRKAFVSPALTAAPQSDTLLADRVYTACPEADTIYMIRTDKSWVAGSFGVVGRPTYLAIDSTNNKLYVLVAKQSAIKVYALDSNILQDIINIPLAREPSFMTLSPDKRWAYVVDERTNYLFRIDLGNGNIAKSVRIGSNPKYAAYLQSQDRLALASTFSQDVLLLDPLSLNTTETIQVSSSPHGIVEKNHLLYVTESSSNSVMVYDLMRRRLRNRISVGLSPRRLLLDENRIYVANYGQGSLSVLLPGQFSVARNISLGESKPLEMAVTVGHEWLYVGDETYKGMVVVDPTTNTVVQRIKLGSVPLGIAVIQ